MTAKITAITTGIGILKTYTWAVAAVMFFWFLRQWRLKQCRQSIAKRQKCVKRVFGPVSPVLVTFRKGGVWYSFIVVR